MYLVLFLLFCLYIYIIKLYDFWKNRGFPSAKVKFFQGNIAGVGRTRSTAQALKDVYDEFFGKADFVGIFMITSPALLLISPEMIKTVLVKHFSSFSDRGMYYNKRDDPMSANLLTLHVDEWKPLRNKLSPAFSTGKIRPMFDIISQISDNLVNKLLYLETSANVNVSEVIAEYSTDIISNIAFGLESNCLNDSNSEIRKYGKQIFAMTPKKILKFFFTSAFPNAAAVLRLTSNAIPSNYFLNLFLDTVKYREESSVRRNDFMQILIDLKNSSDGSGLELTELASESFVFFGGVSRKDLVDALILSKFEGFETTSTTIAYTLYELSQNQDIQNKLRKEIQDIGSDITYESIMEMKYLNMIINETLRKYPSISLTMRKCKENFKIPDTPLEIPKNTTVFIPIFGIHHNPIYYPEPSKFDPERFTEDNIKARPAYAYLPFGDGPRNCIGMRFALIQAKTAIAKLISNFEFSISSKTQIPMKFNLSSPFMTPKADIFLSLRTLIHK